MGWEKRGSSYYYYKKEREGRTVKSVYVGRGEVARMISHLQESFGPIEKFAHQTAGAKLAKFEKSDAALDQLCGLIEIMKQASLLRAGFHTHKRQWRKIRNGNIAKG